MVMQQSSRPVLGEKPMSQVNCRVPLIVHKRLGEMAVKANMPLATYAATLLMAAYSAQTKPPSGDRDLDAAVARVAILWAEKRESAEIAEAVGLHEATVVKVIDAWRAEVSLQGEA